MLNATRRVLMGGALALTAAPLAALAESPSLVEIERQLLASVDFINAGGYAGGDVPEDISARNIAWVDTILETCPRTREDAAVKLRMVGRSFEDGDRGGEEEALQQVVAFLEAH